jgi:hypothetical protein
MTVTTRVSKVSLTGAVLAVAGVLAAGCSTASSGSPASGGPASGASPSTASSSPAAGGTGTEAATSAPTTAAATPGAPATPSPTGPAGSGGTPACATGDLKISIGDGGGGAAGSFYSLIDFTNTSSVTCTLYGYPGVSLRSAQSALIGAPATRNATSSPGVVTLAPGVTASATLKMTDYTVYPASECRQVTSSYLLIYPPNQTQSVSLAFKGGTCANPALKILAVSPVISGN